MYSFTVSNMEMDSCFGTTTLCVYVGSYVRRKSQAQKAQVKKRRLHDEPAPSCQGHLDTVERQRLEEPPLCRVCVRRVRFRVRGGDGEIVKHTEGSMRGGLPGNKQSGEECG